MLGVSSSKLEFQDGLLGTGRFTYGEKTPTPDYEQQWAPNTIQTIIMICNAKGIPSAIVQKL